jgi:hypothetical protein
MNPGESSPVTATDNADSCNARPVKQSLVVDDLSRNNRKKRVRFSPGAGERAPRRRRQGKKGKANSDNLDEAAPNVQENAGTNVQETAALKVEESVATGNPPVVGVPNAQGDALTGVPGNDPSIRSAAPAKPPGLYNNVIKPYIIYSNIPKCVVSHEADGDFSRYILQTEARCGNYATVTQDDMLEHIVRLPEHSYINIPDTRNFILCKKNDAIIARALRRSHSDPEAVLFNRLYLENESTKMFYRKSLRVGPQMGEILNMDLTKRIIAMYPMVPADDIVLIMQDLICGQLGTPYADVFVTIENTAFRQRKKDTIARFTAYAQLIKTRVQVLTQGELDLLSEWDERRVANGVCDPEETFYAVLLRRVALVPANPLAQSDFLEFFWKGKVSRNGQNGSASVNAPPGLVKIEGQM